MAINSRDILKGWFVPHYKLISDRVESIFDSYWHKNDGYLPINYEKTITAADQATDFFVTVNHNLNVSRLTPTLEDNNGYIVTGTNVKNVYIDGLCNQTIIEFSDTITGTYKLTIL